MSVEQRAHPVAAVLDRRERRVGKRVQRPWPMSEATVSMMGRPWWPVMAWKPEPPLNGIISPSLAPSHSLVYRW